MTLTPGAIAAILALVCSTAAAAVEPSFPPTTATPTPPFARDIGTFITVDPTNPLCLDDACTLPIVWQGWMTNAAGWLGSSGTLPTGYPGDRPVWWQPFMDLVDDLGVNRIALGMRPGIQSPTDYWGAYVAHVPTPTPPPPLRTWNWDYHQGAPFQWTILDKALENFLLPLRARLAARGEPLFWNFEYYNNSGGQFTAFRDDPEQFADWVWSIWDHVDRTYGITPDGFSINEPSTTGDAWTMAQVGAALTAIRASLAASGWHPRFEAPASEHVYAGTRQTAPADFDELIGLPGVANYLTDVEYHLYGGFTTADLTAMITRAQTYRKQVGMSEFLNATHNELDTLLRDGKVSYFRQLGLGGGRCIPPVPPPGPATPTPTPCNPDQRGSLVIVDHSNNYATFIQSEAWYLRQYMKFIHMNARAVTATSSRINNMRPVAFINPNGAPVVVVNVVNLPAGGKLSVSGLPAGTYNITYTVNGDVNHALAAQVIGPGGVIATSIPAVGVITIYRNDVIVPTYTPTGRTQTVTVTNTTTRATATVTSRPTTATASITRTRTPTRTFSASPKSTTAAATPSLPQTTTPTRMVSSVETSTPTSTTVPIILANIVHAIFTGAAQGDVNADGRVTAADLVCTMLGTRCSSL